ncbi:sigma-54-dependent Fis family transcriptional regulator [Neptunicella marina]|uniref:Sigma-54-dependent Fis family transcriptional regulator n=1 Tax=Neptunicella marina TaxID=2125989 RepID=A0A8J6IW96_9ALTE|nr:sigma-54-dependent Fis family transcriptional regulator [Neptunicella marina]MBC3766676.1 sigma-54-dependent Fis family transcriptional regulator [Neptunicella marina]
MLSEQHSSTQIMEELLRLTTLLNTERDSHALLHSIVDVARRLTSAEVGRIFILDKTKRYLHQPISQNTHIASEIQGIKAIELFKQGKRNMQDITCYCAFTGKVMNIADIYQFSGFDLTPYYDYDKINQYKTSSLLAVPFRNHLEETIGVLQLTNHVSKNGKHYKPFPTKLETLVSAFAAQAAVTLNNMQLIEHNHRLIALLDKTNRELSEENQTLRKQIKAPQFGEIIGTCKSMKTVFDLMSKVVNTSATVLLNGETGTGKELIAKAIHYNGARKSAQFVAQNCTALPANLLEGELFGYKKGAFSGADRDKKGLIEYANGGTLFLDEIGDMPMDLQAKLLRVIQEREVRPLGALSSVKVDIRIIAATHHSLPELIDKGTFREDLFYRLNVFPIELPPLRLRRDDLPALINYFLNQYSQQYDKKISLMSPAALQLLNHYHYPGNVRELKNILERTVLMCENDATILPEHLPAEILQAQNRFDTTSLALGESTNLKSVVGRYESSVIRRRLEENGGNQTKTARSLGISRRALIDKMQRYAITSANQPTLSAQNSLSS